MKWREGRSNKKWRERVVIIVNKFQGEFSTFYHFSNRGDKVFWYVARGTDGEKGGAERSSYPPGGGSLLIIDNSFDFCPREDEYSARNEINNQ